MTYEMRLADVPAGGAFMFRDARFTAVYEHRGNGWHQVWAKSETGGPWHCDPETRVIVEDTRHHPSQTLSCFV
jgi:hypothetical protein